VRSWQTRLRRLFKLAGVPNGHPHRFRDTFAVELLLAGVPIERVSILLGHQSVTITEKHYAPWVRSRQEQLEADLANAWSSDPLVLLQSGVHQRYTQRGAPTTHSSSIRKTGARGGSRTHMRKNPRRILSPQRLPFRHPGSGSTNLTNPRSYCNTAARAGGCSNTRVSVVVSVEPFAGVSRRWTAASVCFGAR
jgi:Phage integrase family